MEIKDLIVMQHCRSQVLRMIQDGHSVAEVAEAVGCTRSAVGGVVRWAETYDRDVKRALADCRKTVQFTKSAWHSRKTAG
jgi:DNA invertase Pin-like site-specific DNA recombinase